jgi:hypothetical protein
MQMHAHDPTDFVSTITAASSVDTIHHRGRFREVETFLDV